MASVVKDLRYVLRLLLKSPGFTVVAVLTLGAGIGANVTVFSVLHAVLVRSLPLLAESLLLAAVGGILGVVFANWGVGLFALSAKTLLPRSSEIQIDTCALCFTLLLSLLVGILCGLLPALAISDGMQHTLRDNSRGSVGGVRQAMLRNALVIGEIGCALVVLSCAGLLLRSFLKLEETDSGIGHPGKILTASLSLPPALYATDSSVRSFHQTAQQKMVQMPGVRSAGAISLLPLTPGDTDTSFQIVGRPYFPPGQQPVAQLRVISGNYFQAAGIPLMAGRFFDERDGPDTAPTILINRSMALRFWKSEQDAIGNKIDNELGCVGTIVGVVGDVHHFGLPAPVRDEFYYSVNEAPGYGAGLDRSSRQLRTCPPGDEHKSYYGAEGRVMKAEYRIQEPEVGRANLAADEPYNR
jgi:putative ABC transport system permease protein